MLLNSTDGWLVQDVFTLVAHVNDTHPDRRVSEECPQCVEIVTEAQAYARPEES